MDQDGAIIPYQSLKLELFTALFVSFPPHPILTAED